MNGNQSMVVLSNDELYTYFTVGDFQIKYRTSSKLKKYTRVKQWDYGYLVVDAEYSTLGITEEYIDITDVLNDLHINAEKFLNPIKKLVIHNDRY